MKKTILFLGLAFFAASCGEKKEAQQHDEATEKHDHSKHDHGDAKMEANVSETKFGIVVNAASATTLTVMETSLAGKTTLETTVKAKVAEVCTSKGCWMTLEKEDGTTMRVSFKDYALFMPKDLAGKEVIIHGIVETKTTSLDELKHYAKDAGKSQTEIDAITEGETKIAFEADGVEIL